MAYEKRTKEARLAEIDTKITKYKTLIDDLEAKKEAILNPISRARRFGVNTVIKQAKDLGMSAEEIAEKLGIKIS